MGKPAYVGMICGQRVPFSVLGVILPENQIRAVRLVKQISNAGIWDAVVKTGKHRGQPTQISENDIIVFSDRDGRA